MSKYCQRCGYVVHDRTYRYCFVCTKALLREMEAKGYLQDTYIAPYFSDERGRKCLDTRAWGGMPY